MFYGFDINVSKFNGLDKDYWMLIIKNDVNKRDNEICMIMDNFELKSFYYKLYYKWYFF